jgi:hypothetical protein
MEVEMAQVIHDQILESVIVLRESLAIDGSNDIPGWAQDIHHALGQLVNAVSDNVRGAEHTADKLGDINPDVQNTAATDRHVENAREKMIKLGEKAHELRAEIRQTPPRRTLEMIQLRLRGEELVAAIEKVRKADDKFFLDAMNSNPGAGE